MSVLAHVVHGAQQPEPAATQALAYILKSNPVLVRSLIDLLRVVNIEFEPGRVDAELVYEDSQPDITIFDQHGRLRVFVENKFWAGLTEAQPVSYLEKLSESPSSALVFVVPQQRVPTVWSELKQRCVDRGLAWEDTPNEGPDHQCASVQAKSILVVSWKNVLGRLQDVAGSEGLDTAKHDLLQLQGLVDSVNIGAFLPLQVHETNNQETPNRLINYINLIQPIIRKLKEAKIADTKGLAWGLRLNGIGHFLSIQGNQKFPAWLGIHFTHWRDKGISPLWCRIHGHGLNVTHFKTTPNLFKDVLAEGHHVWVPIRLKIGVEREKVIDNVVGQIEQIVVEVLCTVTD